jgi:glycerophosphoryl diester phosphodiesterase
MTERFIHPPLLAHRGASAYAPENTLAAFRKAKDLGVKWLEFDVMLAACGEVVVFHDDTLERTSNGVGYLNEHPYTYLKTLDAGSWFDPQFTGERIPCLREVLSFLEQQTLSANIEIKALPGQEKELVKRVLALLEEGPVKADSLLLSSFSIAVLRELRARSTAYRLGFLMDEVFSGWENVYAEVGAFSLNLNEALIKPDTIKTFQASSQSLLAYTVNEPERAKELFALGVAALFTDCPDKILKAI